MNCKPGDMAIVIGGPRENLGKQVTCVELLGEGSLVETSRGSGLLQCHGVSIWRIDRRLAAVCADHLLMPIRPQPESEGRITGKLRVTSLNTKVLEQIMLGDRA